MRPRGIREDENFLETPAGEYLVFDGEDPTGTDYVRIVNADGVEVLYYDANEFRDEPRETLGALIGAMMSGATPWSRSG